MGPHACRPLLPGVGLPRRLRSALAGIPSHRTTLPFLAADGLAVFKALFDRPKDWLDIAEMQAAGSIDLVAIADTARSLVGDDPRVDRLIELTGRLDGIETRRCRTRPRVGRQSRQAGVGGRNR